MLINKTIYPDGKEETIIECSEKELEILQTQKVDIEYQAYDLRKRSRNVSLN